MFDEQAEREKLLSLDLTEDVIQMILTKKRSKVGNPGSPTPPPSVVQEPTPIESTPIEEAPIEEAPIEPIHAKDPLPVEPAPIEPSPPDMLTEEPIVARSVSPLRPSVIIKMKHMWSKK